jgi:hypothetical protein
MPLAQPDLDSVSLTSTLKRYLLNVPGINIVSRLLQAAGKIERRLVHFHYKDRSTGIDITIMDWDMVMVECKSRLEIELRLPVRKVWARHNGKWEQIYSIEDFVNGQDYYLTADTDPDYGKGYAHMNDFYDAWRSSGLDDEDILIIQKVFEKQRIKVNVLLSLTDEDLEKYGLEQGGLRKAILAVLGK